MLGVLGLNGFTGLAPETERLFRVSELLVVSVVSAYVAVHCWPRGGPCRWLALASALLLSASKVGV